MGKIKNVALKFVIVFVNAALVVGGVFLIKNQQEKKVAANDAGTDVTSAPDSVAQSDSEGAQDQTSAVQIEPQQIPTVTNTTKAVSDSAQSQTQISANKSTTSSIVTSTPKSTSTTKSASTTTKAASTQTAAPTPVPTPTPAPAPQKSTTTSSSKVR